MSSSLRDYNCIISIDFGTTFSGSCFAVINGDIKNLDARKQTYVTELQNLNDYEICHIMYSYIDKNKELLKVPTVIIYDQFGQLTDWGLAAMEKIKKNDLKDTDKKIDKFKLRLPKSVPQKGSLQRQGSVGRLTEDDNLRAAIDYFKVIYDRTLDEVNASINKSPDFSIKTADLKIRFIITVPAIWSNTERAVIRQVAIQAGLISQDDHENRLIIINEPLAATLHVEYRDIDDDNSDDDNALKENDIYVICDAGGGTVDIATFVKTEAQLENYSFGRCQLTADSGGMCGSTYIDQKMRELLSNVIYNENLYKENEENKNLENKSEQKKKDTLEQKEKRKKLDVIEILVEDFIHNTLPENNLKQKFGITVEKHLKKENYFDMKATDFGIFYRNASKLKTSDLDVEELFINNEHFELKEYGEDEYYVHKGCFYDGSNDMLIIPYDIMVEKVFEPEIKKTIKLLDRQIEKVGGYVKCIYLVGGLGQNIYLKKRIEQEFAGKFKEIKQYLDGEAAAMRGAAFYGVDGIKRPVQTDFNDTKYNENFTLNDYDTLISIDVGYDHTSCSYVSLNHENQNSEEPKEVIGWPGLKDSNFTQIPTAFDKDNDTWGAAVSNLTDIDPKKFIVPNRFMSVVKANLKVFLVAFLKKVHEYILKYLEEKGGKTDKSKFRYCITMENSYKYFNKKEDMRRIAVEAGIVPNEHDPKRLLLIKRDDAAAMHFEDQHLKKDVYSTYFLQIFFRHDSCHLSLKEAIRISGFEDSQITDNFRNIRGIRSATLEFNYVAKIVANLNMYITNHPCVSCSANHSNNYSEAYYSELKERFLEFIKNKLDFSGDHMQKINIRKNECCVADISIYDLLEHVLRPAIRDMVSEIYRYFVQAEMTNFRLDQIFLADRLLQANDNTYNFIERIFIKTLADVMNMDSGIIKSADPINQSAVKGAIIYGLKPESYTERVARKTYFVTVEAFKVKKLDRFENDDEENDEENNKKNKKETDPNKLYDIEARNAFRDKDHRVDLYCQSALNSTKDVKVHPFHKNLIIKRGTKITEDNQTLGIQKRFFAKEECIAYASIYTTEKDDKEYPEPENADNIKVIDCTDFQKIHQFEIYIKPDPNDIMKLLLGQDRHYFEIRMIPDNYEAKFEANLGTRMGGKIPEFRFRDEILVANIYDDKQVIELKKTSKISDDSKDSN